MSICRLRACSLVIAALCCTNAWGTGVLKLSRTEMVMEPGRAPPELWIENTGDTPLFLTMEQALVTNPGATPENLVPIGDTPHPSLLVMPGRLVLAPGQKRRMTVTALDTPDQPRVWRLTFRPRERIMVHGESGRHISSPLFIKVGYGVVVYQMPDRSGEHND